MNTFTADDVRFRYRGATRDAVAGLTMAVPHGSFYAMLGPNGSGKSTAMRLLLGALAPQHGVVRFEDRIVSDWPRRELARRIGVVSQHEEMPFPMTVRELVALGRYPHLGAWHRESDADRAAVQRALERCGLTDLVERPASALSGGELQRARIARALAQEPRTLVLDEPTASLDVAHEMSIFELLAGLVAHDGTTVLVITHNINLAARYADTLLLLHEGRIAAEGRAADVLTRERLEHVYGWPLHVHPHPGPGRDTGAPQVVAVARRRDGEERNQ